MANVYPSYRVVATVVHGNTYTVKTRYSLKDSKILGKGSFGVVATANDGETGTTIAIKRIRPYANDEWDAKHTLREIRLLRLLGNHPNIIGLYDLSIHEEKTELYMMMELMDCDLHKVIQSKQTLTHKHFKCFTKQILEGMKAMHEIGVFHRDLKPGNILVSKDCQLRITDFGLARFMDESTRSGTNINCPMTEYVVTRWYRAPELLLSSNMPYSEAIDMWSVGCIVAELIRRKPLFPGKSHAQQVQLIFDVMGLENIGSLGFPVSAEAQSFLQKRCGRFHKQPIPHVIPEANDEEIALVSALLTVNPVGRPSASQALNFAFLRDADILNDYSKRYLTRPRPDYFDFEEKKYSLEQLRDMIKGEVAAIMAVDSAQNIKRSRVSGITNQEEGGHSRGSEASSRAVSAVSSRGSEASNLSRGSDVSGEFDENNGPSSQLKTMQKQIVAGNNVAARAPQRAPPANTSTKTNPFATTSNTASSAAAAVHTSHSNHQSSNSYNTSSKSSNSEGTKVREATGSVIAMARKLSENSPRPTGPKTPSPRQMNSIQKKDAMTKRRFVLQQIAQNPIADHTSNNTNDPQTAVMWGADRPYAAKDDEYDDDEDEELEQSTASHTTTKSAPAAYQRQGAVRTGLAKDVPQSKSTVVLPPMGRRMGELSSLLGHLQGKYTSLTARDAPTDETSSVLAAAQSRKITTAPDHATRQSSGATATGGTTTSYYRGSGQTATNQVKNGAVPPAANKSSASTNFRNLLKFPSLGGRR